MYPRFIYLRAGVQLLGWALAGTNATVAAALAVAPKINGDFSCERARLIGRRVFIWLLLTPREQLVNGAPCVET